jgi:hypothetical protein
MEGKACDSENLRAFYKATQERRIHLSQVIEKELGYAISLNAAIWGFFGKGFLDSLGAGCIEQKVAPWYIFGAALLSSMVVILWRFRTHTLDNTIVNDAYPKIVFYEHKLKMPEELTQWAHFCRTYISEKQEGLFDRLMELDGEDRRKIVLQLSKKRRYGCRGHNTINKVALGYLTFAWGMSIWSGLRSGEVLGFSMGGLVCSVGVMAYLMTFYTQRDSSLDELKEAISKARGTPDKTRGETQS